MFCIIIFTILISRAFCARNFSSYTKIIKFPFLYDFEVEVITKSGAKKIVDLYNLFEGYDELSVRKRGDVSFTPIRFLIFRSYDTRICGRYLRNITRCFSGTWVPGNNCPSAIRLTIVPSSIIPLDSHLMEFIYESQLYFVEFLVKGHLSIRLANYPEVPDKRISIVFNPSSMINCVAGDGTQLHWVSGNDSFENPYVINSSYTLCGINYKMTNYTIKCYSYYTWILTASFDVLHCFFIYFGRYLTRDLDRSSYDAGEQVFCGITPIFIGTSSAYYYNPLYPPVVNIMKNGTIYGTPDYIYNIPENLSRCRDCRLVCGFACPFSSYYLIRDSLWIKVLTNYETYLELPNKTWFKSVPYLYYDEKFRCVTSKYQQNVRTTVVKYENPTKPYSQLILSKNGQKYSSAPNEWFKLNQSLFKKEGPNTWLVYCLLSNSEISTPIYYTFYSTTKRWIEFKLWYPYPNVHVPILEGFIYKCIGHKVHIIMDCKRGCDNVEIKNFPSLSFSVVITKNIHKKTRIAVKCLGYRAMKDNKPLVKSVIFTAFPSELQTIPNTVPHNVNLYTRRYLEANLYHFFVYYDSRLTFIKYGITRHLRTDVEHNILSFMVPSEFMTDTIVYFCYVDTVNDRGELDCSDLTYRRISIITSVEVFYKPPLLENKVNYVDSGTIVSCRICITYAITDSRRDCLVNNKMTLSIFKPGLPVEYIKGYRTIKIPIANSEEVFRWKFIVSCHLHSLKISNRRIVLRSCAELMIIPEDKEIFHVNDTVECATTSALCGKDNFFHIVVFTENILTLEIITGLGVQLDSRFIGFNKLICYLYANRSIFIERKIIVESAPFLVEIINGKSELIVGDSVTCDGKGNPHPNLEWWFIRGPEGLKVVDNHLIVLPSSRSGIYVYDCVAQNIYGELKRRMKFFVHNKYRRIYGNNVIDKQFYICIFLIFLLFIILFMTCNAFIYGYHFVPHTKLA